VLAPLSLLCRCGVRLASRPFVFSLHRSRQGCGACGESAAARRLGHRAQLWRVPRRPAGEGCSYACAQDAGVAEVPHLCRACYRALGRERGPSAARQHVSGHRQVAARVAAVAGHVCYVPRPGAGAAHMQCMTQTCVLLHYAPACEAMAVHLLLPAVPEPATALHDVPARGVFGGDVVVRNRGKRADLAARVAGRVHAVCGLAGRPLQPQVPHLRGHAAVGLLLGGLWPVAQLHAGAPARPPVPHLLTPPAVPRAAQGACPPAAPTPCAVLKPCLWQARLSRAASAPRGRRQRRPVSARSRPAPSKPRPGAPASRGPARRRRR